MSERHNKQTVRRMAQMAELHISTYRPGDGKIRYQIYDGRDKAESFPLYHAVGPREAVTFIAGYVAGRNREHIR